MGLDLSAPSSLGEPRGRANRRHACGTLLTGRRKVSPQPFAGLEALRQKKTPHAAGFQNLQTSISEQKKMSSP